MLYLLPSLFYCINVHFFIPIFLFIVYVLYKDKGICEADETDVFQ